MLITLTTDFGVSSPYVAAMKGALLSVCRNAQLVDLTHAISPQDVRQAAVVLADVTPFFPPGTLHLVVVDPGVGTARNIICAEIGNQRHLAPDNGVLSYLTRPAPVRSVVQVANKSFWRQAVSSTFHGRDIFAPVAGHLAAGVAPQELGPAVPGIVELDWQEPEYRADSARGEVLYIDSFGNIITNLEVARLPQCDRKEVAILLLSRTIRGLQVSYGHCRPGELIALGDSQGRLEIALVNGNAAIALGCTPGQPVFVRPGTSPAKEA